jgi:hypothetical protein
VLLIFLDAAALEKFTRLDKESVSIITGLFSGSPAACQLQIILGGQQNAAVQRTAAQVSAGVPNFQWMPRRAPQSKTPQSLESCAGM